MNATRTWLVLAGACAALPAHAQDDLVVTSSRAYRRNGTLRQVLRVWSVAAGYFLGVSPARLQRWYTR